MDGIGDRFPATTTGGKSHPGAPIPTWTPTTVSGAGREILQGQLEQAEHNHLHLNNTCKIK